MRQAQRPRAGGANPRRPRCASLRDMAERIGAFVAEIGCVRGAAAAERIQNEQNGARHYCATALSAPTASMRNAAANSARV